MTVTKPPRTCQPGARHRPPLGIHPKHRRPEEAALAEEPWGWPRRPAHGTTGEAIRPARRQLAAVPSDRAAPSAPWVTQVRRLALRAGSRGGAEARRARVPLRWWSEPFGRGRRRRLPEKVTVTSDSHQDPSGAMAGSRGLVEPYGTFGPLVIRVKTSAWRRDWVHAQAPRGRSGAGSGPPRSRSGAGSGAEGRAGDAVATAREPPTCRRLSAPDLIRGPPSCLPIKGSTGSRRGMDWAHANTRRRRVGACRAPWRKPLFEARRRLFKNDLSVDRQVG